MDDINKALEATADFAYNDLPEKLAEIYKSTGIFPELTLGFLVGLLDEEEHLNSIIDTANKLTKGE
ncbi:MAG: hypothetical protein ACI4HN_04690 [Ruminococcus sp.]